MEYNAAVVRYFDAPPRARELPPGAPGLVAGEAEDRTQGVWVRFELEVVEGLIRTVALQVYGCPHTVAAANLVAGWLEGRSVTAARGIGVRALVAELEVPVEKLGKLLRIEDALGACWRALPEGRE
jgi:NifU-like protein involved in Fe-S cluster formation